MAPIVFCGFLGGQGGKIFLFAPVEAMSCALLDFLFIPLLLASLGRYWRGYITVSTSFNIYSPRAAAAGEIGFLPDHPMAQSKIAWAML